MSNILFSRTDSPNSKSIIDGQVIFDTSGNGKMYLDVGTKRLSVGGALDVDTKLDANSTNPIQNKGVAGVMIDNLVDVKNTTSKGFLTDVLATKELSTKVETLESEVGTTDISDIGDGTIKGSISDINGKLQWKKVRTTLNLSPKTQYERVSQTLSEIIGASEIAIYWSMGFKSAYLIDKTTVFSMYYNLGSNFLADTIVEVNKLTGEIKFAYSAIGNQTTKPTITEIYYR